MRQPEEKDFYTVSELAELLHFSERTIRERLEHDRIKGFKVGGKGPWRISRIEVNSLTGQQEPIDEESGASQKPLDFPLEGKERHEETPHKQKIHEWAGRLKKQLSFPHQYHPLWDFKPGRYFWDFKPSRYGVSDDLVGYYAFQVNANKKISVSLALEQDELNRHLWKALQSHLRTGGKEFSQVLDEVDCWKEQAAQLIQHCQRLFTNIRKDCQNQGNIRKLLTEKEFNVIKAYLKEPIPKEYEPQHVGFAPHFVRGIFEKALDAVQGYRVKNEDLKYDPRPRQNGFFELWFEARIIAVGQSEEELSALEKIHRALIKKYQKPAKTESIRATAKVLGESQCEVQARLQKFIDMERLPGQCDLC